MSYRTFMIAFAESSFARSMFLRNGSKPRLVRRFIAGDQLTDALEAVGNLTADGALATVNYLGENLTIESEIGETLQQYMEAIKAVSTFYPTGHVSIKLTALGLKSSEDLARERLVRVLDFSKDRGGVFIRVDMEGSDYTESTLGLIREFHTAYPFVGATIQACLRRSDRDVEELNQAGISVRLVKGLYPESPAVAYGLRHDVVRQFRKQMYRILEDGTDPSIATHDPDILTDARIFIRRQSMKPEQYTFEMLMGVRRDLQMRLLGDGHPVRIYVPYGTRWYPYFTRRLCDSPANLGFFGKGLEKR